MQAFFSSIGIVVLLLMGGAAPAYAIDFRFGQEVSIPQDAPVIEGNLYLAGGSVTNPGTITGDMLSLGGEVRHFGTIGHDGYLMGGAIDMKGEVAGDLRIVGMDSIVDGLVGGELFVLGAQTTIAENADIKGGAYIIGDRVIVNGTINGPLTVRARSVEIHGTVKGPVTAYVDYGFSVFDTATITGTVTYFGATPGTISEKAEIGGGVVFTESRNAGSVSDWRWIGEMASDALMSMMFFGMLLTSVVIAGLFPNFAARAVRYSLYNGGTSILYGLVGVVGGFILAVVVTLSVIFFIPGIMLFLAGALYIFVAKALAGIMAGALLSQWWKKVPMVTVGWALAGTVLLSLLSLIPVLGALVNLILMLSMAGSLVIAVREVWWKRRRIPVTL